MPKGVNSWQLSSDGPDWTDVMILMKAIERLHGVLVTVTIGATVFEDGAGLLTIAALKVERDASVLGSPIAALSGDWPCKEHHNLCHCVFAGLYALDGQLGKGLLN